MAEFTFDFCPSSRVAEIIAPDEPEVKDFNGWDYTPTPHLPLRRSFKVTLDGLRWYLASTGLLDSTTDPTRNAGRLEGFYATHRMHKPFNFTHEYLGNLEVRFAGPVSIPKAMSNSNGLIDSLEIMMIHHNPSY